MRKSIPLASPVISILSPGPEASRRAQSLLAAICGMKTSSSLDSSTIQNDSLDTAFQSSIPGFSRRWDSVASQCPKSGSVIHFCAMSRSSNSSGSTSSAGGTSTIPFSLLGITEASPDTPVEESVSNFRNILASQIKSRANIIKIKNSLGKSISNTDLLTSVSSGGLPILHLPAPDASNGTAKFEKDRIGLKEVVIPFFDFAMYNDGSSLFSTIANAQLERPTVGVYQWTGSSTHIRPLPTASEDKRLPPPSLIFHCENADQIDFQNEGARTAKIGFGGHRVGQLMLLHPDLYGLDIRFCPQTKVSSSFSEAQESLLASSLDELQNTNTLLQPGEAGRDDDRVGNGDCWVEVRANLKQPSGYWQRSKNAIARKQEHRIAKPPDLPYE